MVTKERGCGTERAGLWYRKSEVEVKKEQGCGKKRARLW